MMRNFTILLLILGVAIACGENKSKKKTESESVIEQNDSKKEEFKQLTNVSVDLITSKGNMVIHLYDETPQHRDNFVKLVQSKYYDGVIFHRVIPNFMIQTGDPDSKNPKPDARYGKGGPDYKIPAEILPQFYHKKGAVSAARTNNPEKLSSGSQFYIVQGRVHSLTELKEIESQKQQTLPGFKFSEEAIKTYTTIGGAPFLDGDYTVFGELTQGIDIVDIIAKVPTNSDRPLQDIFVVEMKIKN